MNKVIHRVLRFDRFALDLTRGCLRSGDQDINLPPKVFEVLRHLAENAGRLVPKQELYEAVWPNVVVSDDSLVQCIRELRRKLGDDAHNVIKTIPRRGYLLDAAVSTSDSLPLPTPPSMPTGISAAPRTDNVPKHVAKEVRDGALPGERKHVSVLYVDMKEWLELVTTRDPEEALQVFEAVLQLISQAVDHYEGTVSQVTADGIMALFGAPVAHEDHAVRACYAALEIREAVKRYAQGLQPASRVPVLVRAGLNSGEVVIRSIATGAHTERWAMGQTTQAACHLAQIAAPGTLLMSARALRLAEGQVHVKALSPAGRSDLVESVYELVAVGQPHTRFQAAYGLTSFIGRGAEIEQMERVHARAQRGHGQVVAIIGEAGLGKSRLLHEYIRSQRWRVLETACVSYHRAASWQPVIELLQIYFKIADSDDLREVRSKVTDSLLNLDRALSSDVIPLLALLDIPVEDASWHTLDASQRRQRTFAALKRLLLREAQKQPLILAFEDLHWIDSETQAFLDSLIDSVASVPLFLVLTYRPEYEHHWGRKSYYTQVRLNALSPETTEEFLRSLLGDDISLLGLKELLPEHGNPFFIEESVRSLVETNVLQGQRGRYRLVGPLKELEIPPTVQAILAARIDRLPARAKRLLQAASVVGKNIPHAVLEPIAGLGDEELRLGLTELGEAEFFYEHRIFPDLEYTFKHALTHEVAYGSLLAEQRKALHRQIVDVIEGLNPDRLTECIEQLAHHAVRGELREKAVHYLRQAGVKASARSVLPDARAWFEQAIATLEALPESRTTLTQALEIRLELRSVLHQLGEVRPALERLREAETFAERLNDDRLRGRVLAVVTNIHSLRGALDEACASGSRGLAIAQALGDFNLCILATTALEQAHYYRGEYERVVELATDNLAALPADSVYSFFGAAAPPSVWDRSWLVMSLAELGRFTEAAVHAAEAIRLAEPTQHAFTIGLAHRSAGILHLLTGDWVKARSVIEHWIAVARNANVVLHLPLAVASSAWALANLAEASESLTRLREGEQLVERSVARGHMGHRGWSYHALGRTCLQLGRLDEAQNLGECAVESSAGHHGFMAHALNLLADIATHPDRFDAESGEARYRQALALAEPRGMRPLVAHCHLGLSKLHDRVGNRQAAREHLTTATSMYREMDMRFWLERL